MTFEEAIKEAKKGYIIKNGISQYATIGKEIFEFCGGSIILYPVFNAKQIFSDEWETGEKYKVEDLRKELINYATSKREVDLYENKAIKAMININRMLHGIDINNADVVE